MPTMFMDRLRDAYSSADPARLRDIIEPHRETIRRLVVRLMGHDQHFEEILSDTLLTLHQKYTANQLSFPDHLRFAAWLCKVATFKVLKFIERSGRLPKGQSLDAVNVPDPGATPDQRLGVQELCTALSEALDELSTIDRDVVEQKYFYGLNSEEIRHKLGFKTLTAVRTRLCRARLRLAAMLWAVQPTLVREFLGLEGEELP